MVTSSTSATDTSSGADSGSNGYGSVTQTTLLTTSLEAFLNEKGKATEETAASSLQLVGDEYGDGGYGWVRGLWFWNGGTYLAKIESRTGGREVETAIFSGISYAFVELVTGMKRDEEMRLCRNQNGEPAPFRQPLRAGRCI